jgi:hypothetical protein
VTSAVADNIQYAAGNITSVVASAYSAFRQKTFEMQVNMKHFYCDSYTKAPHKYTFGNTVNNSSRLGNRCHLSFISTIRPILMKLC